jgi:hypothetical protein
MFSNKIRTTLITGMAVASFAGAAIVPVAAQADTQKEVEGKGYTCSHVATNFTSCTKDNHEYYCEESTDTCSKIKRELVHKPGVVSVVPGGLLTAPEQSTPASRAIKPIGFPPPLA